MSIEVFVPVDGLQGQPIPGHVLWQDEPIDRIEIKISSEFVDIEPFNVGEGGILRAGDSWSFSGFERPGYFGFILKTERTDTLDSIGHVTISLGMAAESQKISKDVRLFRPTLEVESAPNRITVQTGGVADGRVRLRHRGHGTLFVTVSTVEDSAIKTIVPPELVHAVEGFVKTFSEGLERLKPKYPSYPRIFAPLTPQLVQDRDTLSRTLSQMWDDINSNPELAADFEVLFTRSLLENSDFESMFFAPLLDFFTSMVAGSTILSMPWLEFDVPEGRSRLNLVVIGRDVLNVEVAKFTLPPIEVYSQTHQVLPLSSLLAWGDERPVPRSRSRFGRGPGAPRPRERRARR